MTIRGIGYRFNQRWPARRCLSLHPRTYTSGAVTSVPISSAISGASAASAAGEAAAIRQSLARLVLERGYERRAEPFALSSGGTSRDYVDLRRALSRGSDLHLAAAALLAAITASGLDFDAIGGMTMGADPLAHAVALLGERSWFSVRKSAKDHGTGRRVEGADLGPTTTVVVVEDTVSTGRSALEALAVVRSSGARVVLVCALLDRGEIAAPAVRSEGISYLALLTYRDLGIEALGTGTGTGGGGGGTPPGVASHEPPLAEQAGADPDGGQEA